MTYSSFLLLLFSTILFQCKSARTNSTNKDVVITKDLNSKTPKLLWKDRFYSNAGVSKDYICMRACPKGTSLTISDLANCQFSQTRLSELSTSPDAGSQFLSEIMSAGDPLHLDARSIDPEDYKKYLTNLRKISPTENKAGICRHPLYKQAKETAPKSEFIEVRGSGSFDCDRKMILALNAFAGRYQTAAEGCRYVQNYGYQFKYNGISSSTYRDPYQCISGLTSAFSAHLGSKGLVIIENCTQAEFGKPDRFHIRYPKD